MDLSFAIVTYNEEQNLGRCLAQIPEGCEIVVVDSGSSDRTRAIVSESGATFLEREWKNYSDQKNFAIEHCKGRWVFSLDADEVLDAPLVEQIQKLVALNQDFSYRVERRLVFMGRKMRFGRTKDHPIRLFKRDQGRFESEIHESLKSNFPVKSITQGCLWHYSYKDLTDYFDRFNRYTSLIAKERVRRGRFPKSFHALRPWFEFLSRYVVRGGFLDGYPGYVYALVSSFYAFIKYEKVRELLNKSEPISLGGGKE